MLIKEPELETEDREGLLYFLSKTVVKRSRKEVIRDEIKLPKNKRKSRPA